MLSTTNLLPNATGDANAASHNTGATNWEAVDDPVGSPDDATTFIFTTGFFTTNQDYYNIQAATGTITAGSTINSVDVFFRAKHDGSGTFTATPSVRLGGVDTTGSAQGLGTSFADFTQTNFAKPGGGSYSLSDLDSLQVGIKIVSDSGNTQCTQVYVIVTWTAPTGITSSLVDYWNLQEASGNRAGAFASKTLTDNATVTQTTGPSDWIPQAAQFTAANSEYLSRADEAALSITGDWSIALWCKLTNKPANQMLLVAKAAAGEEPYTVYWDNSADRFTARIAVASSFTVITASTFGAPSTGVWYFIFASYTASDKKVRISVNNGAQDASSAAASNPTDNASAFQIGAFNGPTLFWNGPIASVGLWGRVLTSDEITAIYHRGLGQQWVLMIPPPTPLGLLGVG